MRMAKTGNPHGISGYKRNKCRCEVCVAAYEAYNTARRKNPEKSFTIDPEPLISFITKLEDPVPASTQQTFARWRRNGVDVFVADRHCVRRGAHPSEVYGSEWFELEAVNAG
jgi:hypothetical protein